MTNKNTPQFITFEGGEGSGKSTQSRMLYEYLISKNIPAILTREIGGTKQGEKIRDVLLYNHFHPISELMLVMSARYEHIKNLVLPALSEGKWVICDRYVDSTASYQGQDSEVGQDLVYELHNKFIKLMPDITFFIDLEPKIAMERANNRPEGNNKFEEKEFVFHEKVYKSFKELRARFPDRISEIPAINLTPDELHQIILKKLKER